VPDRYPSIATKSDWQGQDQPVNGIHVRISIHETHLNRTVRFDFYESLKARYGTMYRLQRKTSRPNGNIREVGVGVDAPSILNRGSTLAPLPLVPKRWAGKVIIVRFHDDFRSGLDG